MCILDEDDLYDLIKDKEFFDRFKLTERQRKIVMLHILKGFTFEIISGIEKRSITAVHDVYGDAIEKIGKQMKKMLKEKPGTREEAIKPVDNGMRYIGGDGRACYGDDPGNQSPLAVGVRCIV
jgi:hypothetical protein